MGLDMYARTLQAKLVPEGETTDVNLGNLAAKAVGFALLSADEYEDLSRAEQETYYNGEQKAMQSAKEQGIVNPEFDYWRKFNALHGWMNNLYDNKGGVSEEFNRNNVRIELEDLDSLEQAAQNKTLKATSGFFFGDSAINQEDVEDLHAFIAKARQAIADGQAVFYDSWW